MQPADEMTCQELVELVTEYFEGVLKPVDRVRFEDHLRECPYCRTYLEQMQQTLGTLRRLSDDSLHPVARDALLQVFRDWKSGR